MLAGLDSSPISLSNFHTFGCPCYVLEHRLQSGAGKIPKWEPHARMEIYVGWSPSHATNVSMVLNPRTGHISPQFHVVHDDDFTTVPYLRTATVPPHWAALMAASTTIELYTEKQVGTWQLLPELDVESGDFTSDSSIQEMEENVDPEGAHHVTDAHNKDIVNNRVTFSDEQDSEIQSMCLDESLPRPNKWQMPKKINLDSSGLWQSTQTEVLRRQDKVYSHSTLKKIIQRSSKHTCLVLFSSFCAIGAGLKCGVHPHQVLATSFSTLSNAIKSYHRVNSLYAGTINCFSTLVQSSVASNETFNYKEALQQSDYHDFVKAMIHEVNNHEQ
jgi:hypothetical protein